MTELVVVGGGRMGEALLTGLIGAGWAASDDLAVVEPVEARRAELAERHPGLQVSDAPVPAAGAVLAVKPATVPAAAAALAAVRAMPNTPALVGVGAAAVAPGSAAGDADLAWAEGILAATGRVVRVSEAQLDAVTGLSGSGPAYVFLVAEALIEAGVLAGLPRDVSTTLSVQTLLGSATLLAESEEGPEALRAAVTSPGGTTAAGLRELERHGVRAALLDAVMAATDRARVLGGG